MGLKKITFIGDIMCEPMLMRASRTKEGFDFSSVFTNLKDFFDESDYIIGNLETPLAGEEAGYTNSLFSFNAPDEFADAIKEAGIHLVLTANNHCLDRGIEGLGRTIKVLKNKGIQYAGTSDTCSEYIKPVYFSLGKTRCAVVSYTYGTNYAANKLLLTPEQQKMINLLRPQQESYFISYSQERTILQRVILKMFYMIKEENRYFIKKSLRMKVNTAHADDNLNEVTAQPYIKKMKLDIQTAKAHADIVFFCPHVGGQFNSEPGAFSEYIFKEAARAGCDAIIASHSHVVQKRDYCEGIPSFYSLGNFSMSPNSVYLIHDNKPEYGIAIHAYLDEKRIDHFTFSIFKIIENKKTPLTVRLVDELYNDIKDEKERRKLMNDVAFIHKIVTGSSMSSIIMKKEYALL